MRMVENLLTLYDVVCTLNVQDIIYGPNNDNGHSVLTDTLCVRQMRSLKIMITTVIQTYGSKVVDSVRCCVYVKRARHHVWIILNILNTIFNIDD